MGRRARRRLRRLSIELARVHPELEDPERLIREGRVLVDGRAITNPASLVEVGTSVVLRRPRALRGEAKLQAALVTFDVEVRDRVALDLGAAAGGFTRVLLARGAARVYSVDAGHGQLIGSLRADPRVVNLEGVNLGELTTRQVPEPVEVVTLDLSYLAVARAVPQLDRLAIAPGADLIALVKPMFELGLARPPTERSELRRAVAMAEAGLRVSGWQPLGAIESVRGSRHAVERLVHARRG